MAGLRILISGAGIAGPALAHWLLRHGHEPILVEQAPRLRTGGYMIDFWGVGFTVAERMGLLPQLRRVGYMIEDVRLVDDAGRRVGGFGGGVFRAALGERFISLLRGDLAEAVYGTLEGRVETLFGDGVAGLEEDGDGVTVRFAAAPPRRVDLVIGADGLHSAVREQVFGPEASFERPLGYYAASFSAAGYPRRSEGAYVSYCAPGWQIARYSTRGGGTGFFMVCDASMMPAFAHHDEDAQRAALVAQLQGGGWECADIAAALAAAPDFYFDNVSQIRMPQWSRGRIALVGDACFCPSLLAGQGSALAMAGAYVLAGELGASPGDHAAAFARYEQRLRPFIAGKQKSALGMGPVFAPKTRLGIVVRNQSSRLMGLPVLGPWLVGRMVGDRFDLPDYGLRAGE